MKLQNSFVQALALTSVSHATRIYVSSYSGNITTVDVKLNVGGDLTLTQLALNPDCAPSPSWLEFDKKTSTLYCSDEGNPDPTKASLSAFKTSTNGTLSLLDKITTLNGCVYSEIYENGTILAVANYGGSGITVVDIEQPTSLQTLQQLSFIFSDPGPDPKKPLLPFIHQVIIDPTKKFLLAPDLSGDRIHVFTINSQGILEQLPAQQDISVPKGHGPRHGVFYKPSRDNNATYLYVVMETARMIHGYSVSYNPDKTLNFTLIQETMLPIPTGATAAEIKLTPDHKYLIVSSRNDTNFTIPNLDPKNSTQIASDSLFTLSISPNNGSFSLIQSFPAYGLSPRQFSINDKGTMLAVALSTSNRLVVIGRDVLTGLMTGMLGYLDLDVGGDPGLVTSAVWEENELGLSISHGNATLPSASKSLSSTIANPVVSNTAISGTSSLEYFSTSPASGISQPTHSGIPTLLTTTSGGDSRTPQPSPSPSPSGNSTNIPPTTTSGGDATGATPTPYQTGIASNCATFHKVESGDTCSSIATAANIALYDFFLWNPAVGKDCAMLFEGFYACVGVGEGWVAGQ